MPCAGTITDDDWSELAAHGGAPRVAMTEIEAQEQAESSPPSLIEQPFYSSRDYFDVPFAKLQEACRKMKTVNY